ncbi:hypothetical protein [Corynebacterium urealyticum]|uniref:hypothetical protein n=1 Tax=Corynebacterium urealyticum TaxID=43771 RepID=UPI00293F6933|nr:hypothetical protein [Corynebacterium urealyticum]WOH94670.1 hypothetical protein RZ943_01305 [Corynebacterium urealyticum]
MRRITTAAVAAATALSLATVPAAQAADGRPTSSSQISDNDVWGAMGLTGLILDFTGQPADKAFTSSIMNMKEGTNVKPLMSSFKNDIVHGYRFGTTFDILLGTGIVAVLLAGAAAAQAQGLLKLPTP